MKLFFSIIKFIITHPLNRNNKLTALIRFFRWQLSTRILNLPVVIPYVNNTRLLAQREATCGPGAYYVGLLEYNEMAFILNYLRPEDLFIDIGANIGTFTILASGVIGAHTISIEPLPATFQRLLDNINLNRLQNLVTPINKGLGDTNTVLHFSKNNDSTNRVLMSTSDNLDSYLNIDVTTLDDIISEKKTEFIKIDVEGFEGKVISGGKHCLSGNNKPNIILIELRGYGKKYGIDEDIIHNELLNFGYNPFVYQPENNKLKPWIRSNLAFHGDMLYIHNLEKAKKRLLTSPKFLVHNQTV